jgi:hypothetical protein
MNRKKKRYQPGAETSRGGILKETLRKFSEALTTICPEVIGATRSK